MCRKSTFRSRAAFVSLAVAVLAFAGCGGTKPVTTAVLPPGVSRAPELPQPINATYSVSLAGFKRGSPNGSGHAVVSINASTNELCWTFSQLKNVTSPTVARLFRNFTGASGRNGFLLGRAYKSSGCIHLESAVLGLIGAKPEQFYVNIHDARFPGGAVRGPL